jgi:hypothetical protein
VNQSPRSAALFFLSLFIARTASRVYRSPFSPRLVRIAQLPGQPGGNLLMLTRARALAHTWGSHHVRTLSSYKSDPCFRLCSSVRRPRPSSHAPAFLIPILSPAETSWDLPRFYEYLCLTMYRLTLMLFALLSLILPILAAPVPVPEELGELEIRASLSGNGRVRVSFGHTLPTTLTFRIIGNLVRTWPR